MATYGIARFTGDADLLVVDGGILSSAFWRGFPGEARLVWGNGEDPFAGAVQLSRSQCITVDIVIGRFPWQCRLLERAQWRQLGGLRLPVLQLPDLILTKLFAGGVQDRADVLLLMGALDARQRRQLAARMRVLPEDARKLYRELVALAASRQRV